MQPESDEQDPHTSMYFKVLFLQEFKALNP